MVNSFEVKKEHLELLKNANIEWQNCETGAPGLDPKRPYGDSNVARSIADILGWKYGSQEDETYLEEDFEQDCLDLHSEMGTVLKILCQNLEIREGKYKRKGETWTKV